MHARSSGPRFETDSSSPSHSRVGPPSRVLMWRCWAWLIVVGQLEASNSAAMISPRFKHHPMCFNGMEVRHLHTHTCRYICSSLGNGCFFHVQIDPSAIRSARVIRPRPKIAVHPSGMDASHPFIHINCPRVPHDGISLKVLHASARRPRPARRDEHYRARVAG